MSTTELAPGHLNGLDGIRGTAAIAVLAFHSGLPGFSGGFLGVDVFFVLSGFLTASIALSGKHSVVKFMQRRLLRLWPLMLTFGPVATAAHFALYGEAPRAVLPSMLFAMDIVTAREGPVGWFSHFWTLAIEFRFYLLVGLLAVLLDRRSFFATVALLFLASTTYRISAAADFHAAYYGFSSHSSGMFLGAAVAARPFSVPRSVFVLAIPALMFVLAFAQWGAATSVLVMVPVVELGSVVVILYLAGSTKPTVMDMPVMRKLGELSFGIYVWHYPIAISLRDNLPPPAIFAIALIASTCLAAVSLKFVERPMRSLVWQPPASAQL